ncbi:hypothetical protein AB0I02_27225 [Streptomyces phaeochromogenes]
MHKRREQPGYDSWREALAASLADIAADVGAVGLDAADLREGAAPVDQH